MPSEIVEAPVEDRRARKREARRAALLAVAADIADRLGPDAVTMAALADAADYATASLYTYFPSRSALLAAMQRDALDTLSDLARDMVGRWDRQLAGKAEDAAALARLLAFAELFLTAPAHHRREFRLQQQMLVVVDAEELADVLDVVPSAFAVLDVPRRLLADAVAAAALAADSRADGDLVRTVLWVASMNGVLLVDGVAGASATRGLDVNGVRMGRDLTETLLLGWGASPAALSRASTLTRRLSQP